MKSNVIVGLKVENYKRIVIASITPDRRVMKITGANGSGKSSLIDAIWAPLGGARDLPDEPVRRGAKKSKVTIDLPELTVKWTFTKGKPSIVVTAKDGSKLNSPHKIMKELISSRTYDPGAFITLPTKDQAEILRKIAGIDTRELDAEHDDVFEKRTDANRDVKRLTTERAVVKVPDGAPEKEVSAKDLLAEIQAAESANRERTKRAENAQAINAKIAEMERELETLDAELTHLQDSPGKYTDTGEMNERLADLEESNRGARARKHAGELDALLADATESAETMTARLDAIAAEKVTMADAATYPAEGLTVKEGEVFYNDIPFSQASSAEQLRVAVDIAMAQNPKLRVLHIKDGSLLDSASMLALEEQAEKHDCQVWVEIVDETGEIGVSIEDGHVVENPKRKAKAAEPETVEEPAPTPDPGKESESTDSKCGIWNGHPDGFRGGHPTPAKIKRLAELIATAGAEPQAYCEVAEVESLAQMDMTQYWDAVKMARGFDSTTEGE